MNVGSKLRVARPTDRLDDVVRFYRDGLGLSVLGSFEGHDGFDGVMLGHPEHPYHFEFTVKRGHVAGRAPTQDNLLVFYLPDGEQWWAAVERMRKAGCEPVPSFNPYWDREGKTFEDPDGYRVVLQHAEWQPDGEATGMRLYAGLSSWWTLLSPPSEYVEEAGFYIAQLLAHGDGPARTCVELGSGGGNNASHMKGTFELTLVEPAAGMREASVALNPECEHIEGDMRTVRLGRQFDRVFVHDAVVYMTTREDLKKAVETAYLHCRPGGAALFCPDHLRDNFAPGTDHGGADEGAGGRGARGLRYLEWTWDPDPADSTYLVDYAFLLREEDGSVRVEHDRHVEGLFARAEWLAVMSEVGFEARAVPFDHSDLEAGSYELLVGVRPRG